MNTPCSYYPQVEDFKTNPPTAVLITVDLRIIDHIQET